MVENEGNKVYVRGKWIDFSKETINELFNLKVQKDGSKIKRLLKDPKYHKIVDLLTTGKGKWKATKKTLYESITKGDLTKEAKVWFYFINSVILPSKHLSIVRMNEAILLYALLKGYKINCGEDDREFYHELLQKQMHGLDSTPQLQSPTFTFLGE